jgi:hypothetical protein
MTSGDLIKMAAMGPYDGNLARPSSACRRVPPGIKVSAASWIASRKLPNRHRQLKLSFACRSRSEVAIGTIERLPT